MKEHNIKYKDNWLNKTKDVLNKVKDNIREDGKFGYSFSSIDGHVTDYDGFAGCYTPNHRCIHQHRASPR